MIKIKPLAGVSVLVTRPLHQAKLLAGMVDIMGGTAVLLPVLEITSIVDLRPLLALIKRLEQFDLAIFVSPNAVNKAMGLIMAQRTLPVSLRIAVIGKGSADALQHFGVSRVIVPASRYDSEALLDQAALQHIKGKRVVIFRGNGGRTLLGDTLIKRGATLEYVQCYRRSKPDVDATTILTGWSRNRLQAVTATSSEGLRNLFAMTNKMGRQCLEVAPLFSAHERIIQTAKGLGVATVITTKPGDSGLLQGLLDYF